MEFKNTSYFNLILLNHVMWSKGITRLNGAVIRYRIFVDHKFNNGFPWNLRFPIKQFSLWTASIFLNLNIFQKEL